METKKLFRIENITPTTGRAKINKVLVFESIADFVEYVKTTPFNKYFDGGKYKSSLKAPKAWNGNVTYDQAMQMLYSGWSDGAQKLNKKLAEVKSSMQVEKAYKNILDVSGFQPVVPLYLAGAPNCMVRRTQVPKKQKVITINRSLCCSSSVSAEKLMEESTKVLQIIYKLEKAGYRINLNLVISNGLYAVKIKLKRANERINISKLAFPLIHPAFFRRIFFRFVEVSEFTTQFHACGYGVVPEEFEFKEICTKNNEIHLPTLLYGANEADVKTLSPEELIERLK